MRGVMSESTKRPVVLIGEGDIRYGPSYYRLEILGKIVPDSIFGENYSLLDDGKYVATEEWLTTDYVEGPATRVTIFDLENNLKCSLEKVEKGFVGEFEKLGDVFRYRKMYKGKGKTENVEITWNSLSNWLPFHS